MTREGELTTIAYCGLSCAICSHTAEGCVGCHAGGGPEQCTHRNCCREQGIAGCWECAQFPCDTGFSEEAWRGLTIGCCQVIREVGVEACARLLRKRFGNSYDYGYLRFKTPEQIVAQLLTAE